MIDFDIDCLKEYQSITSNQQLLTPGHRRDNFPVKGGQLLDSGNIFIRHPPCCTWYGSLVSQSASYLFKQNKSFINLKLTVHDKWETIASDLLLVDND
jgi:hypothetical protein